MSLVFSLLALQATANLPPPAIREPIGAACMISIANNDKEREMLKDEVFRDAAARKARKLSSFFVAQLRLVDEMLEGYPAILARRKDLHDHGLITDKEFQDTVDQSPQKHIEDISAELKGYPDCGMIDRYPDSPAKRAILEQSRGAP